MQETPTFMSVFVIWCAVVVWALVFAGSLVGGYYLGLNDHSGWAMACFVFAALLFAGTWAG